MNATTRSLSRSKHQIDLAWALGAFAGLLVVVLLLAQWTSGPMHAKTAPVSWVQDETTSEPADVQADVQINDPVDDPADAAQANQAEEAAAQPPALVAPSFTARRVAPPTNGFDSLGDLDNPDQLTTLSFTPLGAGLASLKLPDEFETVAGKVHVTLQEETVGTNGAIAVPFAALSVQINDEIVYLIGTEADPVWAQVDVGVFEAYIDDTEGNPVVRIERRFTLKPSGLHGFFLEERIDNLTSEPINARLVSTGAIDMPKAKSTYAGDRRRVRYGYLLPAEQQGTSLSVTVDDELKNRSKLLGKKAASMYGKAYQSSLTVWPNEDLLPGAQRLAWIALADRYFLVAMHPKFDPAAVTVPEDKLLKGFTQIDRLVLDPYASPLDTVQVFRLVGETKVIPAGKSAHQTLGVYAGPRNRPQMNSEPEIASLNMPAMVVSNLGGICAPCTFSWLTDILIGVLRTFHMIVGDWAVAILLLVVVVRSCLHPVTRWSQIRVQRFGVQMQSMAPKQKAIREKYKDDSKRQQAEMGKLWREEGISPAGMLGCLPMFLQSPVWIALYATLFYASELRHEPAFYGVFQNVLNWQFMNDLAAPDGAIPLPQAMHFSFPMWGNVASINVLPILLGFVMYAHQKYLTPPTQATATPEQQSQQKMMKLMTIFLFPVMMYAAPSGLALYFITNSSIAVIENKWIRSHMKKHGMLEIENIRASKKDKGPGFIQRMTEAADAQKQLKEKGPAQPNPASKYNRRGK
jgi:YidC/Oxa1 family membrane protein insertase